MIDGGYQIIPGGALEYDDESRSRLLSIVWIVYFPVHKIETVLRRRINNYKDDPMDNVSYYKYSPW